MLAAPVVFVIGVVYARNKARRDGSPADQRIGYLHLFPTFVLGFVGMALLNTLGLLPELTLNRATWLGPGPHTKAVASLAEQASRICIIVSMAGVGLETRFAAMRQTGLKPFAASSAAVLLVAALVVVLIKSLGI